MTDKIWLGVSLEDVRERLKTTHKYSTAGADSAAQKIEHLSQALQGEFRNFWQSNQYRESLKVGGIALSALVERYHGNVVGAFLMADWLIREPEAARKALANKRWDYIVQPQAQPGLKLDEPSQSTPAQMVAAAAARSLKT
jgi:hypothetical protein